MLMTRQNQRSHPKHDVNSAPAPVAPHGYTTSAAWEVRKDGAFNDNRAQMHGHCASIVASGKFNGASFSSGDDYIAKCSVRKEGPSNQTRWNEVAINHHITHVLGELAMLGAAP